MVIPSSAQELSKSRDEYRIMRENVMLVVRDYNNVISELDLNEKKLFHWHLKNLEKKLNQGRQKT